MDLIQAAVQMSIIGGAIWSIISYVILKPLDKSITRLEKSVDILSDQLDKANERNRDLAIKIAEVDRSTQAAHRRLDDLMEFCRQTHENFPKRKER